MPKQPELAEDHAKFKAWSKGLMAAGTPFRAVLRFMPLTRFKLEQAARMRHRAYVEIRWANASAEERAKARTRHEVYVRNFYHGC